MKKVNRSRMVRKDFLFSKNHGPQCCVLFIKIRIGTFNSTGVNIPENILPVIPRSGRYKFWLQAQRRGTVATAPFVIDVP